jgi:hypothetical protein
MSTGTFTERVEELRERTGRGQPLRGSVTVDQIYAHYQHERLNLHHPRGGGAKYLERPLLEHGGEYLAEIARTFTDDGGQRAMAHSMEHLSDEVEFQAPWEFGDLIHSGHPQVQLGIRTVYDRPPKRHRLSETELRAKNRLRWNTLPDALKGWIYWHNTVRGKLGLPPLRGRR